MVGAPRNAPYPFARCVGRGECQSNLKPHVRHLEHFGDCILQAFVEADPLGRRRVARRTRSELDVVVLDRANGW